MSAGNKPGSALGQLIERGFSYVWWNYVEKTEIGLVPKEYNARIHGPYDPSRFYGKPDTPFGEVKLQDMKGWLQRREKGFTPFARLMSRAHHRWSRNFVEAKYPGLGWILQFAVGLSLFFYVLRYEYYYYAKRARYHW